MKRQVYNPFLPLWEYIPDGEPHVFGDRVYLYGSHDKEGGETFCMLDYTVWSAPVNDLTDWRCEGVSYRASQDPDYPNRKFMYAPDVVQGNDGRYYLYYCMSGDFGVGGYHNDGPRTLDWKLWNFKAMTVVNCHERRIDYETTLCPRCLDLIDRGYWKFRGVTRVYSMDEFDRANEDMESHRDNFIKGAVRC